MDTEQIIEQLKMEHYDADTLATLHIEAAKRLGELAKFKQYFYELYGTGLEVANWHFNDELEPFDTFYDNAEEAENEVVEDDLCI